MEGFRMNQPTSKVLKSNYKTWNYKTSFSYKNLPYKKKPCINIVSKFLIINIYSVNVTERVGKNFKNISANSTFSFLAIGLKTKTRNWRKVFYNMFYHKLDIPNFK